MVLRKTIKLHLKWSTLQKFLCLNSPSKESQLSKVCFSWDWVYSPICSTTQVIYPQRLPELSSNIHLCVNCIHAVLFTDKLPSISTCSGMGASFSGIVKNLWSPCVSTYKHDKTDPLLLHPLKWHCFSKQLQWWSCFAKKCYSWSWVTDKETTPVMEVFWLHYFA